MADDDLTLEDCLRASDEYDVSDIEKIPESVREKFEQQVSGNME
jgi:hypothetical protein